MQRLKDLNTVVETENNLLRKRIAELEAAEIELIRQRDEWYKKASECENQLLLRLPNRV